MEVKQASSRAPTQREKSACKERLAILSNEKDKVNRLGLQRKCGRNFALR